MPFEDKDDLINEIAKQSGVSAEGVSKVLSALGLEPNISQELSQDDLAQVQGGVSFQRSAFQGKFLRFFKPMDKNINMSLDLMI